MYNILSNIADESGIWKGERKHSHAFLLSPSVYHITKQKEQELQRLGIAIYDCLSGLSHIAAIACASDLNYGGTWSMIRKVFSTGVPKIYQELQGMNIKHIPHLLKVDFMVDQLGEFKIAEIDGHNKHGMGYSTLGLRFREALYPQSDLFPGVVSVLSEEVKRSGYGEVKLLYADQERFYVPEFEIARQEFARHGIDCVVMSEMDADESFCSAGLFIDLPFLYHRSNLYQKIIFGYMSGEVEFIIPPKPFLGSKGVLALLRNDGQDEHLEAILHTFIKKSSLEFVRKFIPATVLVGKRATQGSAVRDMLVDRKFVLKESISSGMKGTTFSDDPDFDRVLKRAYSSDMNWILQEEVINQPQTFSWFEVENGNVPRLETSDDWFMRVTTQYVNRKLADVIVTARRDKSVHGAKDCIQIGGIVL